jgi:hypothetical protein
MVDGSGKNRDKHIISTLSERMDGGVRKLGYHRTLHSNIQAGI